MRQCRSSSQSRQQSTWRPVGQRSPRRRPRQRLGRQYNGNVRINITDSTISLQGTNSIIGRTVMVHDKKDDLGKGGDTESKMTGNAGGRVACGVVGLLPTGRDSFKLSLTVFPDHRNR
ncbi:SOD_CuZN6 [Ramazzottius varieornatus]|uniref:Superoxide dismutase [Cu-Zn] n=1 Tax=Ramazzottius varieornatus TaxID=947166 RepID=A0A1D1UQ00_RAMVA|nr:SOD_CuZN6 [Ramazzottius varieornatus]